MFKFFMAISSWLAVSATLYALFAKAEAKLRPDVKANLRKWLLGQVRLRDYWSSVFCSLFDGIFKMKRIHAFVFSITLPSPLRVILASLISQVVLWILWFNAIPDDTLIQFSYDKDSLIPFNLSFGGYILQLDRILVIILLFNVVADYVSFSKTRLIIGILTKSKRAFVHLLVIICDALITSLIALGLVIFYYSLMYISDKPGLGWYIDNMSEFISLFFGQLANFVHDPYYVQDFTSIFIFSTYLTSIWLWLFLLGIAFLRLLNLFPGALRLANRFFVLEENIRDRPLQVITIMLIVVVSIGIIIEVLF